MKLSNVIKYNEEEHERKRKEHIKYRQWLKYLRNYVGDIEVSEVDMRSAYNAGLSPGDYVKRLTEEV